MIDEFSALNLGISGIPGFLGRSNFAAFTDIDGLLEALDRELPSRIASLLKKKSGQQIELPTLSIHLNYKNSSKLEKNRKIAMRNEILTDREWFRFKGNFAGKKIKGKLRLKGDLKDHFRSRKRFSMTIQLDSDSPTVNGFRRFSMQKPESRQFPHDPVFQDLVKKLDILSVSHEFVQARVNGETWGAMNIQELFSPENLERQRRKNSLILKFGDETQSFLMNKRFGDNHGYLRDKVKEPNVLSAKQVFRDPYMRGLFSFISNELEDGESELLFDTEKFATQAIFALAWGSPHVLLNSNSRFYVNPYSLLIEPYSSDQSSFKEMPDYFYQTVWLPEPYAYALRKTLSDGTFFSILERTRAIITAEIDKSYRKFASYFPYDKPIDFSGISRNFSLIEREIPLRLNLSEPLGDRNRSIEWENLEIDHIYVTHFTNGLVRVRNLINKDITIESISNSDTEIWRGKIILSGENFPHNSSDIESGAVGILDQDISVKYRINGRSFTSTNNLSRDYDTHGEHTIEIESPQNSCKELGPNVVHINKPTKIIGCLLILPGTTLKFSSDSFLHVLGNITAIGTTDSPIVFQGQRGSWKGLFVNGSSAKEKSTLKFVTFKQTTGFSDQVRVLTGGVNFYRSDLSIEDSQFFESEAEDALNIIETPFSIDNIWIKRTRSDGLDIDFSDGSIGIISVSDIGGDGIDISGSTIDILKATAVDVRDKSLSVGENSSVKVGELAVDNSGVGVAAKDASQVDIRSAKVGKMALAAGMTYLKKSIYEGKTYLNIHRIENLDNNLDTKSKFMRQIETEMIVNGRAIQPEKIDVESLYSSGIMKK